jgi:hypothetical protein
MKEKLEKRMYFLVPYNISEIQKGIQAGHSALEYANKYKDDDDYIDFIENWKTWIILNGGTTNSVIDHNISKAKGTLNQYLDEINLNNIKYGMFFEPDLNNALTAICLVVDERVFNQKKYPDFELWYINKMSNCSGNSIDELYEIYCDEIGKDIAFLKKLLNNKKLA